MSHSSPTTTPTTQARDGGVIGGPVGAHRGLRRRRLDGGAAAARRRVVPGARRRGLGCLCSAMCAALIAMTWRSEPAAATWRQVALFGCAGLWFGLTSL